MKVSLGSRYKLKEQYPNIRTVSCNKFDDKLVYHFPNLERVCTDKPESITASDLILDTPYHLPEIKNNVKFRKIVRPYRSLDKFQEIINLTNDLSYTDQVTIKNFEFSDNRLDKSTTYNFKLLITRIPSKSKSARSIQ